MVVVVVEVEGDGCCWWWGGVIPGLRPEAEPKKVGRGLQNDVGSMKKRPPALESNRSKKDY